MLKTDSKLIVLFALLFPIASAHAAATTKPLTSPLTVADLMAKSETSDWRTPNPENLLYLELPNGRVIIELDPDFAPESVANIKLLAKEKYWDGLAVVRVQDNYVVQWADPNAEKPDQKKKIKNAKEKIPAELDIALNKNVPFDVLNDKDVYAKEVGFSNGFASARDPKTKKMWLTHCYGAVGVGRDAAPDSGNGSELYAVIGNAPRYLDRNVTVVGRIIQGMEFMSSLPRGHGNLGFYEKPEQNIVIRSIALASDVPEKDRTSLEVMRTDTTFFKQLIEARKNRKEDWFHYLAGHIDICNMPVPVREKK